MGHFDIQYSEGGLMDFATNEYGLAHDDVGTPGGRVPRGGSLVSMSTTFNDCSNPDPSPSDVWIISVNGVRFYVHRRRLSSASKNNFNFLIPGHGRPDLQGRPPHIIALPEDSNVLNVMLHTIYDISCDSYHPSFETLASAIGALRKYGVSLQRYMAPATPLFTLVLNQAPMRPIETYALAAENELNELAVSVSSHLLSFQLRDLTDELATRMGPIYLRRLVLLHHTRTAELRRIIFSPPYPHGPTNSCGIVDRKALSRAWVLAAAQLAWDAKPDLSSRVIKATFGSLLDQISCTICKGNLMTRVKEIVIQWSIIDRTI